MAAFGGQEVLANNADGSDTAKQKIEQRKKGELIREVHKLDIQIQAMERERSTHVFSKRSDFRKDFSTLEEINTKLIDEQKEDVDHMKRQLSKTSHMVKRFRRELTNIKPTPEFVERLKLIMEEIEGAINMFKEEQKQKYEELVREERTIQQELQALERKFEAWSQVPTASTVLTHRSGSAQRPLASARDITKDLPPEVAAFEKFLHQSGGHRGGWDEYDQGTFLKFRNRYKGRIVFLDHLKGAIPTRTEEEVREHETWYQEYLFLNEQKKDAIKNWREKKEEEKDEILSKAHEGGEEEVEEEDAETKKRVQDKIDQEKRERFSRLNSWKVQKELERAMSEEKKLREEMAKTKKQDEDKKRQVEIRAQVEEFRKQREEEESFLRQQKELRQRQEIERRNQESAREIVKFRSRDLNKLQERLAKEVEKENEQKQKERQLQRMKNQVEAERDPSRLLKPTAGWKARLKDKSSGGGQVLHMPHRAVPGWRKT